MKFYFTFRWPLNDQWNLFGVCGFSGQKWFELVVQGEEIEDQVSTQETEKFALYINKKSKILVRSSPGNVRVDWLQLLIFFTILF